MTFRDYLRVLRRRSLWFIFTSALTFGAAAAYLRMTERPTFTARTRVLIEMPRQITLAEQVPRRVLLTSARLATWQRLIVGPAVREAARKALLATDPHFDPDWLATLTATPEQGTSLVVISADGPTPEAAALLANAVAAAAEAFSAKLAVAYLDQAIAALDHELDPKNPEGPVAERSGSEGRREGSARRIKEILKATGPADVRAEVRRLRDHLGKLDTRLDEVRRKIEAGESLRKRIRTDRALARHFEEMPIPQDAPVVSLRQRSHPRVQILTDELAGLHRRRAIARRKYQPAHPEFVRIEEEIRKKERELAQARRDAVSRDLDAGELKVVNEVRLAGIERDVILRAHRDLDAVSRTIAPLFRAYEREEKKIAEITGQIDKMRNLRETLASARIGPGYVQRLTHEEAKESGVDRKHTKWSQYWLLCLVVSLFLGAGTAYVRELLDTSLRTDYDVRRHLNLPVLCDIPTVPRSEILILRADRGSFLAEKFDTLATLLQKQMEGNRAILVTSPNPREGKSCASLNLAVAFARQGRRTLLLDGDTRAPSLHALLGKERGAGFSDLLTDALPVQEGSPAFQTTEVDGLRFCSCGARMESPYAVLDSARIRRVVEGLRGIFDFVVIDSPPILLTGDALKIASAVEETLLVVSAGGTEHRQAAWTKRLLENVGAKIPGILLNRAAAAREQYYYYYAYEGKYGRRQ